MATSNKKNIFTLIITFLLILFKYIECWSYLFTQDFHKSKLIIGIVIALSVLTISGYKFLKYRFKRMIIIGVICLILTVLSKSIDFIVMFSLVVLYSNKENGEIDFLKNFFKSSLFLFIVTIILNIIGILPSFTVLRVTDSQVITRYNLGFYGANSLFAFFYPIVISFFMLHFNDNINKKMIIGMIVVAISTVFYIFTNCRTGMLCILIATFTYIFKQIFKVRFVDFCIKYHYILFTIFALILAIKFNMSKNSLNMLLSGRPHYWNYYLSNHPFPLFGTDEITRIPIDNIYLNNYFFYGVISYVICLVLSILPFKSSKIDNRFYFMTFAFGMYGFFENNIAYVFSFLFFFQIYYIINYIIDKENIKYE